MLKPAELTPLTAIRLGELALEAGLPEGVFTVLPGKGSVVGERFVDPPRRRARSCFTGSTEVGKRIMAGRADQVKRVTLELGGKSANIVFADADLEQAAATAPYGVFDNAGQDCCARSRILVERSVYDRFLELLEPAVQGVVVGDPGDEDDRDGPADQRRRSARRCASYVEARRRRRRVPRRRARRRRLWYPPTVVLPSRDERPGLARGGLRPGRGRAAVRRRGRRDREWPTTPTYGLSGSIWTRDVGRALRVARGVEAGNLSVNSHSSVRYSTPFGGFKQSGLGRELGPDALDAFTEVKNVFIATMRGLVERHGRHGCDGPGRGRHRRLQRHRPGHRAPVRRRRARTVVIGDLDDDGGPGVADEVGGTLRALRRHRRGRRSTRCSPPRAGDVRRRRHRVQQRRHLARPTTTRSSTPASTPGAGCRRST